MNSVLRVVILWSNAHRSGLFPRPRRRGGEPYSELIVTTPIWLDGVSVRRPPLPHLRGFVATLGLRPVTYDSVGMTVAGVIPPGYRRTDHSTSVTDFERATAAVRSWATHIQGWAHVLPSEAPIVPGCDVAVLAQAAGLWWLAPARVVAVVDEPGRWGFAYGTLEGHVVTGEEFFVVEQTEAGPRFRITASSKPADRLAAAGMPLIRRFQRKFVTGALEAVQEASA